MFSTFRSRFGVSGVIAVISLVFAMAGGAVAAKHFVITSLNQIKPSVRKQLTGKRGPAGLPGLTGAQGQKGDPGSKGEQGIQGKEGTIGNTLPTGVTETGTYGAVTNASEEGVAPVAFTIPLEAELDATHVHVAPNASCSGTAASPTAAAGHLCVYPTLGSVALIFKPNFGASGAFTSGAVLITSNTAGEPTGGTWAVTAP